MIVAKTDIDRMPPNCCDCPKRLDWGQVDSTYCDLMCKRHTHRMGRPEWCPLQEVDETLPAQLAAAELRLQRMDRLLDANE